MKTTFLLLILFFSLGCRNVKIKELTIEIDGQPFWIQDGAEKAKEFWLDKNIELIFVPKGKIAFEIKELPSDRLAQWEQDGYKRETGKIVLIPELKDFQEETNCVIAHEIGHVLNMEHVEQGNSLLAPVVDYDEETICMWSSLDQEEFCLYNKGQCE